MKICYLHLARYPTQQANAVHVMNMCAAVALAPFGRRVEALQREISSWFSPLKIFEYMAQGRAIVAPDLPVLREVLEHGRNAWLVEPEDAEAWVHAVVTLREDAALRRRLGCAAFEDFRQRCTWTERARKVLENLPETAMPVGGRRPGSRGRVAGLEGIVRTFHPDSVTILQWSPTEIRTKDLCGHPNTLRTIQAHASLARQRRANSRPARSAGGCPKPHLTEFRPRSRAGSFGG